MKNTNIIHRLKIASGHFNKVIEMAEKDEYCIDIVHQSKAVQAALRKIDNLILKDHMETCMANEIKNGKGKQVIKEFVEVLEKA